jgi:hypothetical protein
MSNQVKCGYVRTLCMLLFICETLSVCVNRIGGAVSILTLSAVDRGFEPRSC